MKITPIDFANIATLHILAAGLSLAAMQNQGRLFYALVRPTMFGLGASIAYLSWIAGEPAWVPTLLFTAGAIFVLPLGSLWAVVNPLVALAYSAHLFWVCLHTLGWH